MSQRYQATGHRFHMARSATVVGPDGLLFAEEDNAALQPRPNVPLGDSSSSADLISFESSELTISSAPSNEPLIASDHESDVLSSTTAAVSWADVVDLVSPPLPPGEENL